VCARGESAKTPPPPPPRLTLPGDASLQPRPCRLDSNLSADEGVGSLKGLAEGRDGESPPENSRGGRQRVATAPTADAHELLPQPERLGEKRRQKKRMAPGRWVGDRVDMGRAMLNGRKNDNGSRDLTCVLAGWFGYIYIHIHTAALKCNKV
jgi:hypothetical protein